jgi:hypothetical protein
MMVDDIQQHKVHVNEQTGSARDKIRISVLWGEMFTTRYRFF